jgi:hypothetical protein
MVPALRIRKATPVNEWLLYNRNNSTATKGEKIQAIPGYKITFRSIIGEPPEHA